MSVVLFHPDRAAVGPVLGQLREWRHGAVYVHCNEDTAGEVAAWTRSLLSGAHVTGSVANLGFAGGHNRLLERAFADGADAVVVHNPDLVLAPHAVERLLEATGLHAGPALWGPLLELAHPTSLEGQGLVDSSGIRWTRSGRHLDQDQGAALPVECDGWRRTAGISGACMLVTPETFEAITRTTGEFFDESFLAFREDAELGFRAGLLGIPSYVVLDARGRHARQNRGSARGRSAHVDRLGVRNRFLMAFKYGTQRPGGRICPWLRDLVVVAGVLLRERASVAGLGEAWALRALMREKGSRVRAHAVRTPREAALLGRRVTLRH